MARIRNEPLQPRQAVKRQRRIGDKVRSAIDVNAMVAALEKCVRDLCHAAVQREVARQLAADAFASYPYARLGPLNLEAAIVRYVNLFVGVIDQEHIAC